MNHLIPFWAIIIAILWTGFFVLEGFDFGVGMLHGVVGRDDAGRRAAINTIGPLWDGNEVWLVVAAAAIFAAFPGWYATMFSGFYLLMALILVALIIRGVSFEYRGKTRRGALAPHLRRPDDHRQRGRPAAARHRPGRPAARSADQLQPELHRVILGPVPALRPVHRGHPGADLRAARRHVPHPKTTGELRERAGHLARRIAPFTGAAVIGFVIWTHVGHSTTFFLNPIELLAILAVLAAVWLVYDHREGFAFTATTVTMASCIVAIFVGLYPNVMVSSTNAAYNLTVHNTASNAVRTQDDDRRRHRLTAVRPRLPGLVLLRIPASASAPRHSSRRHRPPPRPPVPSPPAAKTAGQEQ